MNVVYDNKSSKTQEGGVYSSVNILDSSFQNDSLQRKADLVNNAAQRAAPPPRPNNTGMPDNLKSGIESLSGFSMDDVRVHYNSSKPATVQALAYTQGTDIHVAPGQEKHLPHEAWHVAQQMAGRVSPTTNINGMPVNDNAGLEHEADVMGEKAASFNNKIENKVYENSSLKHCCLQRQIDLSDGSFSSQINSINELTNHETFQKGPNIIPSNKSLTDKKNYYITLNKKVYSNRKETLEGIADQASSVGGHITSAKTLPEHVYVEFQSSYNTSSKRDGSPKTQNKILLNMVYSYGKEDFPGYVVKVDRSKENKQQDTGKMVEGSKYDLNGKETADALTKYKVDKTSSTKGQNLEQDEYTNCHHKTNSENIFDLTRREKTETGPKNKLSAKNWDAYTKLTGEGARFQCVRRNIEHINDDTVFYPIGQTENDEHGIKFSDLWKTWSKSFNKAYNIPDKDISEKMRTNGNQLIMSNGGPSTSTNALPGNRVKLDGVSTIENEKNFDEELVKLSWKLKLDTLDMDTIQELEELEKNIVYKLNSREAIKKYCSLEEDERKKINGLESEKIEKILTLDKKVFTMEKPEIIKILALEKIKIEKILALEESLRVNILAFESEHIDIIISLEKEQITEFFRLEEDQRKKIFDWKLGINEIKKIIRLEKKDKIFTHCSDANQVENVFSCDESVFELDDLSFKKIISFEKEVINSIFRMKPFLQSDYSSIITFVDDLKEEQRAQILKELYYSTIEKLIAFDSTKRNIILRFNNDKINKLLTFEGDNLTTLLELDFDGLNKILSLNENLIALFLTELDQKSRGFLIELEEEDIKELIECYKLRMATLKKQATSVQKLKKVLEKK